MNCIISPGEWLNKNFEVFVEKKIRTWEYCEDPGYRRYIGPSIIMFAEASSAALPILQLLIGVRGPNK
jgi:hypothetical protein